MPAQVPAPKQSFCDIKIKADLVTLSTFSLPVSETHNAQSVITVELAANEANRVIDFTKNCVAMHVYWVKVLSTGGLGVLAAVKRNGLTAPVADNFDVISGDPGIKIVSWNPSELPPSLYLTNPDSSNPVEVEIGVLGNFS